MHSLADRLHLRTERIKPCTISPREPSIIGTKYALHFVMRRR